MRRGRVSTLPLVSETTVSTRLRIENVASRSPVMERGMSLLVLEAVRMGSLHDVVDLSGAVGFHGLERIR